MNTIPRLCFPLLDWSLVPSAHVVMYSSKEANERFEGGLCVFYSTKMIASLLQMKQTLKLHETFIRINNHDFRKNPKLFPTHRIYFGNGLKKKMN